ncbi:hypothetical protein [Nocardioides sp.]|uniref:hypothetical protein n=1 Tax=Nocardioides sp. TaxID=35761 RepID=UPI00378352E3
MSKMDNLRAMREARYEAARTAAKPSATRPAPPVAPPVAPVAPVAPREDAPVVAPAPDASADTEALCGHRSMNGRTCTREAGHAAKSHRYS